MLPLGLEAAAHYRRDFSDVAAAQALVVAGLAEERLGDQASPGALRSNLARLVATGEGIVILSGGASVDHAGVRFVVPSDLTDTRKAAVRNVDGGDLLLAAAPFGDASGTRGVAVVARSTQPLTDRIQRLWWSLAGVALAAGAGSVVLAIWLSRWVARPLRRLEEAARYVGAGDLDVRAGSVGGPLEVRHLAAAFDTMAARLGTLLDSHRSVIADVSHQLRTPMAALRLRLELMAERGTPARAEVEETLNEVNRLSRLVDGLLAVARAEAATGRPVVVDVRAVAAERVSAWSALAAERGVDLLLQDGANARVWVVADTLEQALDNLLGNCFDLEPPPGHVSVSVRADADWVRLAVADDGPGMSAAQRDRAFQRFATDHADTGGSGLGLAIVHGLITSAGGSVTLSEARGGGLCVEVALPSAP